VGTTARTFPLVMTMQDKCLQPSDGVRLQRRRAARADVQHVVDVTTSDRWGAISSASAKSQISCNRARYRRTRASTQRAASVSGLRRDFGCRRSRQVNVQRAADQHRSPVQTALENRDGLTRCRSWKTTRRTSATSCSTRTTEHVLGDLDNRSDARLQRPLHLRAGVLGAPATACTKRSGRVQVSGVTFFQSGQPLSCGAASDRAGVGTRRRSRTIW